MRRSAMCALVLAGFALVSAAGATPNDATQPPATWHGRLGVGVNPVLDAEDYLPIAHTGFGASVAGFYQLPYRLSVGAGFDLERYTYDSANSGDDPYGAPRYVDQSLYNMRAQALLQWDIWTRSLVTPYVWLGPGYLWQHAESTDWQCHPDQNSGPVVGAGAGLDVALSSTIGVGVEYRVNTPPLTGRLCNGAQIDAEPRGVPGVTPHRFGLTFSVRH